ncbi:MAG TPA: helix-turn-helix transcriptional regulator [Acidobacteriaceae bacterium]|jgi:plasmid maintenance system antidote protein VapI|nr:helix-turn-helix transcriptional regulator [Acidobacteriaceae bacterium]
MNFQDLQESVRSELQRRVNSGLITATSLARQVGFKQSHISNFLNRRRALSLEGLDRVLAAQNLSVDELLPVEISGSAAQTVPREASEAIPLVAPYTAMEDAVVRPGAVIEMVWIPAAKLTDSRARPAGKHQQWQRFLAIRADAQQAAAMEPMILADSIVVLDRHYNSLAPYRSQQRTLYAVRSGSGLMLRFVEFDDARLVLRPLSLAFPLHLIAVGEDESPSDYIVGRVVLVLSEL